MMNYPEYNDPRWQEFKQPRLQDARSDFAQFYRVATPVDAKVLDTLVLTRAVLEFMLNSPREYVAPTIRLHLERLDFFCDQVFMNLRDRVRECPTFARLGVADQAQLEHRLFEVWPVEP